MATPPTTPPITLTPEGFRELRDSLRRLNQMVRNTPGRAGDSRADHEEFLAPEVYLCRAPVGGIPALTEDPSGFTGTGTGGAYVPGKAECDVYRVLTDDMGTTGTGDDRDELQGVEGLVRTVCNADSSAVAGGAWLLAVRDKWGTWWAVPTLGGSGEVVECRAVVVPRVLCAGGQIQYAVEYDRYDARGWKVSTSNVPCGPWVDLGGIGDGTCDDCANLNRRWYFRRTDPTVWVAFAPLTLCETVSEVVLSFVADATGTGTGGIWALVVHVPSFGAAVAYFNTTAGSGWDGTTDMVLDLVSPTGTCSNWPASVTVEVP